MSVRFRILPGAGLKRLDGMVYTVDVDAAFRAQRMRRTTAAEALLVLAENHKIGRGNHPLVALINGLCEAFKVREGDCGDRDLSLDSDGIDWYADHNFLGVVEP